MAAINTNLLSLSGQANLKRAQSGLATAMERLSSGLRVNSAKDDAAGQAIGNRMTAEVRGHHQAQRNTNDGISLSQTAQGALDEINDRLQRIRELTVQGLNGIYEGDAGDSIQAEINLNLKEIDRLTEQTHFNGIPLLDGTAGTRQLQVGTRDNQTLGIDLNPPGFSSRALGLEKMTIQGTPGTVTPVDHVTGTARRIPLDDADYTTLNYSPPNGSPNLVDVPRSGNRDLVQLEDQSGRLMEQRVTTAHHDTATRQNQVTISVEEPTTNRTAREYLSSRTYLDSSGAPMNANGRDIVNVGDKYWIQSGPEGQKRYQQAELTFHSSTSGISVTAQALSEVSVGADELGGNPQVVNYAPGIARTADNYSLTFDGNDASGDTNLSLVYLGGNYFIEDRSDSDQYAYFDADVTFRVGGEANDINVVSASDSRLVVSDQPYVTGTSTVHLNPANNNVRIDYIDRNNVRYEDVMVTDGDGQYRLNVTGTGDDLDNAYKTAKIVTNQDGEYLLQTVNGNGEVVLYYPTNYPDGRSINTDVEDNRTVITLRETDIAQRLRTPARPLEAIDAAIERVDSKRSAFGALDNRLASAIENSENMSTNLAAARSRIMDADYAVEVANMTRAQILQQAGTSMLAQANQIPQSVLSLLG